MNPEELFKSLTKELNGLRDKANAGTMTAEERSAYKSKMEEWKAAKADLEELNAIKASAGEVGAEFDRLSKSTGSAAAILPPKDNPGVDPRVLDQRLAKRILSLGRKVTESNEYKEWKKNDFKGNTGKIEVGSFYHGKYHGMTNGFASPEEQYALITAADMPTDWVPALRMPGIYAPDQPPFTVRSAFLNLQTTQKVIAYYRELSRDNNAAFVAEATDTSPTTLGASGVKPESGVTWERATSIVETLANWMPITNEIADDDPAIRGIIEGILVEMLTEVEDDALINGGGTSPDIEGLINVTGIQEADTAGYFNGAPVVDAGGDNENFNRLLRARRLVRQVGRATPNFYFINPADMEVFMSTTDANNQYMAGGPFAAGNIPTMWRLPVIETEAIEEGEFFCGDGRLAAVFDRMTATVTSGWINDQFIRNMFTLLAEERLGFAVFRPAAFVHGEFA